MMDPIYHLGITFILYLQSLRAWLATPMQFFTFLGTEDFFLFVAPAVYWCINALLGLQIGLLLMVSDAINYAMKISLHGPRPYWYDRRVLALSSETSFGVPSGHAQHAVVVWGAMAAAARRKWAWIAAVLLMFFIGFSRLALGMHFPSDVLVGWMLGALILWAFLFLQKPVGAWVMRLALGERFLAVFAGSLALLLIGALSKLSLGAWVLPSLWATNAALADPSAAPIDPLALSGLVSNAGVFFGLAAGWLLLQTKGGFDAGGSWWKRLARFPIGLAGVFVLWYGLGAIFPRGEFLLSYGLRYLRYALVGFWISAPAPWIFIRLGLAEKETYAPQAEASPAFAR